VHCLDAYTIPELRGRNIHAALLREMLLFNAGLGYRCGYSKITVTNRQSPKAHRRLGWERTGTMLLAGRASGIRVVRLSGSTHPWRRLRPEDY
jgi:L-amino acid N-acyltransferase YncA